MDFKGALCFKEELASNFLFSRKPPFRIVSFAGGATRRTDTVKDEIGKAINGVGILEREDGEHLVKLLTRSELPMDEKKFAGYFGKTADDIMVDPVGSIHFMSRRIRRRPLYPGISVGHYRITAGTIGCFVENKKGEVSILSNNHVLANCDDCRLNDAILQPGPVDGGQKGVDNVAALSYFVPLERTGENKMDAALASVDPKLALRYTVTRNRQIPGTSLPRTRLKVEKFGRTTGYTIGSITARSLDIQVDFDGQILNFEDQFEIKGPIYRGQRSKFCEGGDSGSLILERGTFNAVGLLFAGTDDGTTFATPIDKVLTSFGVKIL